MKDSSADPYGYFSYNDGLKLGYDRGLWHSDSASHIQTADVHYLL